MNVQKQTSNNDQTLDFLSNNSLQYLFYFRIFSMITNKLMTQWYSIVCFLLHGKILIRAQVMDNQSNTTYCHIALHLRGSLNCRPQHVHVQINMRALTYSSLITIHIIHYTQCRDHACKTITMYLYAICRCRYFNHLTRRKSWIIIMTRGPRFIHE